MANYTGNMTTFQSNAETRIIRQVDDKIAYYDPTAAPLINMLMTLKRRAAVKSTHLEWYEKDYLPRWANTTGAVDNNPATVTIPVDDGTKFVAGDCGVVAPPKSTFAKTEVFRVVSVSANNLTVVRAVGGSNIGNIASGGGIRIIGPMYEEFAPFPTQKRAAATLKSTYTQIFRTPTAFSNTAEAVATYGVAGSERDQAHIEDMVEHKQKLNSTLIWGRASQSFTAGPSGYPIRSTSGLIDVITTNVLDAGGMLTYRKFQEFARMVFRYGPKRKVLVAAPLIMEAVTAWGEKKQLIVSTKDNDTIGIPITTVRTAHGDFAMVRDWMLENDPNGVYGWGELGLALDLDQITYLYLSNNSVNRDTKVLEDVVKDGADGKRDEIRTEAGFKIKLEKNHGIIANCTDYMA